MAELTEQLEEMESLRPQSPPFLREGSRQFSTSRFSLNSTLNRHRSDRMHCGIPHHDMDHRLSNAVFN